ncbi:hypothetical protein F5B18DRAFT_47187 [Nemania serpens]|nr:hypothetical protein F5B18DRAFT_47187 [Nemania serpens]
MEAVPIPSTGLVICLSAAVCRSDHNMLGIARHEVGRESSPPTFPSNRMGGVSLSSMPIGLFIYSSFSRPLGILDVPDKTFIRSLYEEPVPLALSHVDCQPRPQSQSTVYPKRIISSREHRSLFGRGKSYMSNMYTGSQRNGAPYPRHRSNSASD